MKNERLQNTTLISTARTLHLNAFVTSDKQYTANKKNDNSKLKQHEIRYQSLSSLRGERHQINQQTAVTLNDNS